MPTENNGIFSRKSTFGKVILSALIMSFISPISNSYASSWSTATSISPTVSSPTWWGITSSSDGVHLAIANQGGYIYISNDSGTTWTKSNSPSMAWQRLASSSDGSRMIASVGNAAGDTRNEIYISNNYGEDWTATIPTTGYPGWQGVTSSADGSHLTAAAQGGCIYRSVNSGTTWESVTVSGLGACTTQNWRGAAASSDGQYLAVGLDAGNIYTSNDFGATWTARTASGNQGWYNITSSSNGQYLAATTVNNNIWTSADFGVTWTQRKPVSASGTYYGIASDPSGQYLVATAAATPGEIYASNDYGASWVAQSQPGTFRSVASASTDGTHWVAGNTTNIYIGNISFGASSSDSKLSNTIISSGTLSPTFSPTTTSYTSSVSNSTTSITLTPTVNESHATVQVKIGSGAYSTVTSGTASSSLPLSVGANTITVLVTAQDNSTTSYTITVTRAAGVPSSVSTLTTASTIKGQAVSSLGTPSSTLGGISSPGSVTITRAKAADTSGSGSFVTSFVKTDSGAMINKVVKYSSGASTTNFDSTDSAYSNAAISNNDFFIVKVTAANGTTVSYYKIVVTVPALASISTLQNLYISPGVLNPGFASGTTTYVASVSPTTSSLTVKPTYTGTNETVTVNGIGVPSATWSGSISLSYGVNPISVIGTAEDGSTTIYTLNVTRVTSSIWTGGNVWSDTQNFLGVASSEHGETLTAVSQTGYIYNSYDSGATWVQNTSAGLKDWRYVTSSSDGVHQAATVYSGNIYVSNDSGATWSSATTSLGTKTWWGITSNSDNTKIYATVFGGCIYSSSDSGLTWGTSTASLLGGCGFQNWRGIASDSSGNFIVAVNSNEKIYTSGDGGSTWTGHAVGGIHNWISVSSSADGSHLAAVENNGYIWISSDYGATWNSLTSAGSRSWWGVSVSHDGTRLTAASATVGATSGVIYYSASFGAGFSDITPNFVTGQGYRGLALSGDGTRLLTSSPAGDLYVATPPTIASPTFSISVTSESATVGSAINGFSITSSGGAPTSYSISPTISNGLSFNTSTGAITGTPTSTAPAVTYTLTAWNGGGSASVTFTIEVAAGSPPTSSGSVTTPDPQQTSTVTPTPTQGSGSTGGGNNYVISGSFPTAIANISVADQSLPNTSWVQTSSSVAIIMPPHEEGTVLIQIYNGQVPLLAPIPYVYSKNVGASTPTPTPTPTPTNIGVFGFKTGSAAISKSAVKVLTRYAVGTKIIITGYAEPTDPKGDFKLSLKRAQSVKAQLLKLNPKLSVEVVAGGTSYNSACASARNKCVVIQKIG